jgi:hypothetical protein
MGTGCWKTFGATAVLLGPGSGEDDEGMREESVVSKNCVSIGIKGSFSAVNILWAS